MGTLPSGHHRYTDTIMQLVCRKKGEKVVLRKKTQPYTYFDLYNKQQGIFNVCYIKNQVSLKSIGWVFCATEYFGLQYILVSQ